MSANSDYPIVVYPCEEGGYVAEVPALRGCLAQGESIAEVLAELEVVRGLWLETAQASGLVLPDVAVAVERVKALS
ncbi:MAG: type II toxin-antitoxin system HicB family antitoxin [Cyanobacteria bacterium P01_G01_bin.54]